ncbi:hypothetical protein AYI70_g10663 [Smittium culicis]|uniref:Uncharacterized protein n=1 Tax=Smittium culicis TaxID=133412 RepID=A0A1R1X5I1_9FUNG|nr:hypothetical protein AYI70_g12098 [Smittium culicis]OMJ09891.1 hypothetical protein AYI70_g10663 [Smittium culicis]
MNTLNTNSDLNYLSWPFSSKRSLEELHSNSEDGDANLGYSTNKISKSATKRKKTAQLQDRRKTFNGRDLSQRKKSRIVDPGFIINDKPTINAEDHDAKSKKGISTSTKISAPGSSFDNNQKTGTEDYNRSFLSSSFNNKYNSLDTNPFQYYNQQYNSNIDETPVPSYPSFNSNKYSDQNTFNTSANNSFQTTSRPLTNSFFNKSHDGYNGSVTDQPSFQNWNSFNSTRTYDKFSNPSRSNSRLSTSTNRRLSKAFCTRKVFKTDDFSRSLVLSQVLDFVPNENGFVVYKLPENNS